jgi:two-component system cell cycle response regulator
VDDLEPNVKLLEAKLTAEYFEVLTALSGQAAIEIAREQQPDIILLDVMMPGLNGFETCERLKADETTWHIPVVMVTALDQQADRIAGLNAGADDFLSKPVQDIALFARVRSLTRFKQMTDELRHRHDAGTRMGVLGQKDLKAFDAKHTNLLVVTDEGQLAGLGDTLTDVLTNVSVGFEHDARIAIDAIRRGDPDLVLIDLGMKSYDPLRLCSAIRAFDTSRLAPLLAVAHPDSGRQVVRALDLGVSDYLLQPIEQQELAARVRTQLRRMRYIEYIRASFDETLELAVTDQLTGVYNRRFLANQGSRLIDEARSDGTPLTCLMIDVDHFKLVNDTYGHDIGDDVLREISKRLTISVRGSDLVSRFGGEEFCVLMPRSGRHDAHDIARRVLSEVNKTPIKAAGGLNLDVTVSIGVSVLTEADNLASLLKRADDALYRSKENGRNRFTDEAA